MKRIKKLMAMFLTVIMIVAMAVPAFADETGYTITINNETSGHTYEAYQVFAGDLSGEVLSNITWGNGVNDAALLTALKADQTIGDKFTNCESAADVAKVLAAFESNTANLDAFAAVVGKNLGSVAGTSTAETGAYTISELPAGYYFVKDKDDSVTGEGDAYTKFMLKLVQDTAITPKSDVPTVEKKVQEDDKYGQDGGYGNGYNDVADWNIGDSVPFKLIGTVPKMEGYDTYKYIFHDTLSDGLTLNEDSIKVYVADSKNADLNALTPLTKDEDYSVNNPGTEDSDECSFEISFSDLKTVEGVSEGKFIIVAYTATLNESAEIGLDGNPNEVYLEFSNNPAESGSGDTDNTGETPEDEVIVFTYELDTTKVDGTTQTTKLPDAEFVLLNKDGNKVAKVNASTGKFEGWVDLPTGTGTDSAITYEDWTTLNGTSNVILKSNDEGLFKVIGLDDGEYKLREIKAPAGYNLLTKDVEVKITAATSNGQEWTSGTASDALTKLEVTADETSGTGDENTGIASITIANNKGATLPETGGMGTTLFYIVGGILVLGAGILLITRRRMSMMDEQ